MIIIRNEQTFQDWVMERFAAMGAHVQDFSAHGGDVPDLSAAYGGQEYWLELKYGVFHLLHAKYDDFYYRETKRGQLEWLRKRALASKAICGILGYAVMKGDHSSTPYITFHTTHDYLSRIWQRNGYCCGAVMLSPESCAAHLLPNGPSLLAFIDYAACGAPRNAG